MSTTSKNLGTYNNKQNKRNLVILSLDIKNKGKI